MAHTEVMTMRELCVYSKCHQTAIYRPIKRKALPTLRSGPTTGLLQAESPRGPGGGSVGHRGTGPLGGGPFGNRGDHVRGDFRLGAAKNTRK